MSAQDLALTFASLLEGTDPIRAAVLADPDTRLEQLHTPYFRRAQVYRAFYTAIGIPLAFTVGHAEDWATVLLELNPEGWETLAESGVDLTNDDMRIAYALGYLEGTRSMQHRFQIVRKPTDIGSFEGLNPTQQAELAAARERIRDPIISITDRAPWIVRAYVIEDFALLRVHLTIDSAGRIDRKESLLQDNLPLPLVI